VILPASYSKIKLSKSNKKNRIELLREFESVFKTALAHESKDPGVPFNEKTEGRKSREAAPLIVLFDELSVAGLD
jgi:hypothetical protein